MADYRYTFVDAFDDTEVVVLVNSEDRIAVERSFEQSGYFVEDITAVKDIK